MKADVVQDVIGVGWDWLPICEGSSGERIRVGREWGVIVVLIDETCAVGSVELGE